ncbi:MAG TPA: SGNH/GDSL hydrolase family protein [Pirellulaceae bacterium]|jgi:lysophospholipase L1-like esterase|nr:SGNH/GDSL hydrolase family protein [Pirellulaceae bacterium]
MLASHYLRAALCSALAISLAIAPFVVAKDRAPFALENEDRVVFLGDSITQGGTYIVYVDAYVRTRFPDRKFELINHGLSSETINGMSEDDHPGRRPWVHDRLERDALRWKPDVLSICYGMNDGNYFPMHPERFAKFKEGYARFFELVDQANIPRVHVLTPPPFDAYRRKAGDEKPLDYGYRFPAVDYDRTLATYAEWLLSQRSDWAEKFDDTRATVVDLHTALNELLRQRRQGDVSYSFSGDAVHPDATGHLLIAMQILKAWNSPDLGSATVEVGGEGKSGSTTAIIPLPMPRDPRWDEKMVELSGWSETLTTFHVASPVREGKWKLMIAGHPQGDEGAPRALFAGEFAAEQLSQGVKLNADGWEPMQEPRAKVLANVQKRSDLIYRAWRKDLEAEGDGQASIKLPELEKLDHEIAHDARPWAVVLELERLD